MKPKIPEFDAKDSISSIRDTLDKAGAVVIHGAATAQDMDNLRAELAPYMDTTETEEDNPEDFYAGDTKRITALMIRSKTAQKLALNLTIKQLCDHHLLPNCEAYRLHVTAGLEVAPGAREQILHREEDLFPFFKVPRPNLVIASMWAVGEFRADNGGTLIVPGSHKWEESRKAEPDEIVAAEMPKGSALIWLGGTLHGAGANVSDDWRYGVILTYSLGWLRQEENMILDYPPHLIEGASEELKKLLGYDVYDDEMGFYDPRVWEQAR